MGAGIEAGVDAQHPAENRLEQAARYGAAYMTEVGEIRWPGAAQNLFALFSISGNNFCLQEF